MDTSSANVSFVNDMTKELSLLIDLVNRHRHTFTCHKYAGGKNGQCRFRFPRLLHGHTHWNGEEGMMKIKRNDRWINPFNPYMLLSLRCNHDIKFLSSGLDATALAYYICNYVTKSELSTYNCYQLLAQSISRVEYDQKMASAAVRVPAAAPADGEH